MATLTTFTANTTAVASEVNTNFTNIEAEYQGLLDNFFNNKDVVLTGCDLTQSSTPGLDANLSAGKACVNGELVTVTAKTVTFTSANGSNPRWDLVSVDNSDSVTVTAGTAAANPTMPAIPANEAVIAAVYRATSDNTINTIEVVKFWNKGSEDSEDLLYYYSGTQTGGLRIPMPNGSTYKGVRIVIHSYKGSQTNAAEMQLLVNDVSASYDTYGHNATDGWVSLTGSSRWRILHDSGPGGTRTIYGSGEILVTINDDGDDLLMSCNVTGNNLGASGDMVAVYGKGIDASNSSINSFHLGVANTSAQEMTFTVYGLK